MKFRTSIVVLLICVASLGMANAQTSSFTETMQIAGHSFQMTFDEAPGRIDVDGNVSFWFPEYTRTPAYITVSSFDAASSATMLERMTGPNGLILSYTTETAQGGMGGTTFKLRGRLDGLGTPIRISCVQQSEWAVNPLGALNWCMPLVFTLRPTPPD